MVLSEWEGIPLDVEQGIHYTATQLGPLDALEQYRIEQPIRAKGKIWLRNILGLTGMEVSLGTIPPGKGIPYLHQHGQHEELYIFLKGAGQFQVDGNVIQVKEGTAIRVSPEGKRGLRNHTEEELQYLVVQAVRNTIQVGDYQDGALVRSC